jgi:aspartokinase-like uncharacterized kinase
VAITWVIKLGGSLFDSDRLRGWLDALAEAAVVIVPGGGPFADQVRLAQQRWRFDDQTAHVMAILAMAQYGRMLAGIEPGITATSDVEALSALAEAGRPAVWLPDPDKLADAAIAASWDVTSDSLAAWLACRIGARRLLLVKSAPVPAGTVPVGACVSAGWLDPAFPRFFANCRCDTWLCGPEAHRGLRQSLCRPEISFTRVIHEAV